MILYRTMSVQISECLSGACAVDSTRHDVRRKLVRRIAIYALIGVVWTYATTAAVVLLFPIPTFNSSARAAIHRAEFDSSRPFLRLRVWTNAWGSYFQIHRTSPLDAQRLARYYDVDSLSESQKQALMENPKLDDPSFIPRWSRLRRDWPARLVETRELLEAGGVWNELRMGWPLHCLRGGWTTPNSQGTGEIESLRGVIPFRRLVVYINPGNWAGFKSTVGLPLIPDWPAFLASVLLYAVLTFASATAWRSARSWRRRRRGHCVGCGYDLRGSTDRCPECGLCM